MTQKELANAVGVDVSMISKYESGQVIPPTKRLFAILDVLDVCIENEQDQSLAGMSRLMAYSSLSQSQTYIDRLIQLGANGHCELCQNPAPFIGKDGRPYLEVFTINPQDTSLEPTKNKVALCPNCHKKVTVLGDSNDIGKLKKIAIKHNY